VIARLGLRKQPRVVAPAIGNAIFDATGACIREVPFTADRIKAALAARQS
jgi:CO/xanthine dehydrogenase Mo-binding subunit